MLRLGDIDFKRKPVTPQLFLCKPNKQTIAKMGEAYEIVFSQKLGALNELNFVLPVFIDKHHTIERNQNADIIRGRYLVKLLLGSYEEYFVITTLTKDGKDDGETISVQAMSLGYEMNDKIIRDYTAVSKTASELLKDMLVDTIWKIGYVDSAFDLKYRGLEVSSSTVLEQVFEVAKTFNALVTWNTLNRTVNFIRPDLTGQDKGFRVKYGKYLSSLNQEENVEEIITRMKLYGKEDISIREINPTGTVYIEDFNYFVYPYQEIRRYLDEVYSGSEIKASWTHNPTEWSASGGVLNSSYSSNRSVIANTRFIDSKDYKISATFRAFGEDNMMGIVVRYIDANNYYFAGWESGKTSGGLGWGGEHVRLYKVVNGVATQIAGTSSVDGWSNQVNYTMAVEVYNDTIKVWIDNRLVLRAKENTHKNGGFGFVSQYQNFSVTNVKVNHKSHDIVSHSEYMTDELCHSIIEYDALLQANKDVFANLVARRGTFASIINTKNTELNTLNTQYKILLDERDVLNTRISLMNDKIAQADNAHGNTTIIEGDRDLLLVELNAKIVEIGAKMAEINMKQSEITIQEVQYQDVLNEINTLKVLLDVRNNFTPELIAERNQYIIEKEWQDSNIDNAQDLLTEGMKAFDEAKEQKITLKVEIANLLSMITEQRNWEKLGMGDTIGIEHERLQVLFKAKITEIEYTFDDAEINITISNVKDFASRDKLLDMLYKSYSSSTTVSIDSWKWDLSVENKGSINEIINNIWDANKQSIIGAKDQVVEISDRGLLIRDPNDPLTYLVGLNGMIAITNDGGNTWKHAITGNGIVGERIYGKIFMGVNLALEDEDGVLKFQGSKGEIFDRNGRLVMKLGLVNEVPDVFGLWSFNDITRVKVDDREGFAIERATKDTNNFPDGWEKVMWADPRDGTLYAHDLVAENIKIVNDIGKTILDSENNYLDIGDFKNIVMDNKLTTLEKMQIITELYKIEAGYRRTLEQAAEYQRSQRDAIFDMNAQFFSSVPSTIDLYSTQPLTDAYYALMNYMSQYIAITSFYPLNINVNDPITEQTSEIRDRAEFILKFQDYYDEERNLMNLIGDAQFYSGLNMGEFYNNVVIGEYGFIALRSDGKYRSVLNATNGLALQKWESNRWVNKVYASIGNSQYEDGTLIAEDLVAKRLRIETKDGGVLLSADALNFDFSVLDKIILDDVIISTEKITLANNYKSITKQYQTLKEQINKYVTTIYSDRDKSYYGLDQAKDQLKAAGDDLTSSYNSLTNYMNPVFADMNRTTHIIADLGSTRFEFHQKWENFYQSYESARSRLADFLERSSLQLGRDYNNTVIDAENGVVVTRGNMMNRTTLNATEGIKIEKNIGSPDAPEWEKRFYVDLEGNLFADELSTRKLRILDAKLGDAIIFDWMDGITINGQHGEQIRLNGNEGIAIDVDGEPRFWIHNDGTLRAKKLIVIGDEDDEPIELPDGSYISKLVVNEVRTMNGSNAQDYIHIKENFFKFYTGTGGEDDLEKLKFYIEGEGHDGFAAIKLGIGVGNGDEIGYIRKDASAFKLDYTAQGGYYRRLHLTNKIGNGENGIIMQSEGAGIKIVTNGHTIRLEADASNYIEVSRSGVKIVGTRIDLN